MAPMHLHCPRCRLAITCRADYLKLTNCPRCLARAGLVSPLSSSSLTRMEFRSAGAHPLRSPRVGGDLG